MFELLLSMLIKSANKQVIIQFWCDKLFPIKCLMLFELNCMRGSQTNS